MKRDRKKWWDKAWRRALRTLLGTNNIWSDTGDAEVTYRADTALYVAKKIAEALG